MVTVSDIASSLERYAPLMMQEKYDNSGLQIGNSEMEVKSVLLCIDVTEAVMAEAKECGANMIVSHHPLLFNPLKSLTGKNETERVVMDAIRNDIAIYSSHTNMDSTNGGVSHRIAKKLNLSDVKPLEPMKHSYLKLVTWIPQSHLAKLQMALYGAGAGDVGPYDCCSYSCEGEGTFRARPGAHPYSGEIDMVHTDLEQRLEVILPVWLRKQVVEAMLRVHPYEVPAYDLIPLENEAEYWGLGVIGTIKEIKKEAFLDLLKKRFDIKCIRCTKGNSDTIKRVAICGGSGASLISTAVASNADIYITGDVKYHDFLTYASQIIIADIGHYESEQYTKEIFYDVIQENFPKFATYYSQQDKNPINYL